MNDGPEAEVLRGIRLLLTDVDGVLTNGHLHFDSTGREVKVFHVHDGAGIVYWHRYGGMSGLVSGRGSEVVQLRGKELGMHEIHLGHHDKRGVFEEILERRTLSAHQVAYVGDDLLDLPILRQVGFAAAPQDARPEVREQVHYVARSAGGQGVIREIVELLLKAQDKWDEVVRKGGLP
ncbi:MAG: HAD hydrolase family protein [Planctomycetota bacterium]